ncbi:gamma-tubulin complex [Stylonychia lemnae]|uniref:Gamma-tubulin complex n=1 Tax=Stylonychia lemnae TaxID=5949 RepID=A0A078ALA9_STYLE|nr:gamma-tubulin complex [Stylonychia lemnae]|eukprot:CDW82197.1 gamma-tubulin complex [Stylonychia lemnae]
MENPVTGQFIIAKSLQDLVTYYLPGNASDAQIQKFVQYFLRILSSRLQSSYQNADHDHLRQLLLKKVTSKPKPNNPRSSIGEEAQRFENLFQKFKKNRTLNKSTEMLHLLLQLSGEGANNSKSSGGVLESVFNNKIINKIDYQPSQNKKRDKAAGNLDIEMKDSSSKSQSTKQKQLDYLKNMRYNSISGEINEDTIVRDLIYVFQGIQGQHIQYSMLEDSFILSPSCIVSPSTRKIINELCELGWLFKKVYEWLSRNQETQSHINQVTQSLTFAIQSELTEYYRLIAILESQKTKYSQEDPANYLNLKKLYLWIQEPLERMKWLAIIIDSVQNLRGGAVCSAINSYVLNGSPSTKQFISRILKEVSSPILNMIKQWMIEGEINDPFQEFFVEVDPIVPDDKLWTEKYKLNYIMIPSFLTNALAHKILLTGKAVNFIRRCCQEQDWILDISLQLPFETSTLLVGSASDTFQHLKNWVDHAYQVTNQQLLKILFTKYKFEGHCNSIRKYLLMGQGDFMQYLMDLLSDELNNSAAQIYRHQLMGQLETAIRSSNAQYHDPEFLNRLDIRLLESSPGDKGWEIFMLDYRVNDLSPLSTVFTEDIMQSYKKVFNFLWRLKRIEYLLSQLWRKNQEHSDKFEKIKGMRDVFHKFNLYHHEMVHFVSNIHNYIMVEVLESQWKIFQDDMKQAQDLDQLIEYQKKFVNSILDKALLNDKNNQLYRTLQKLLQLVYSFTYMKDKHFYQSAIDEYERIMNNQQIDPNMLDEDDLKSKIRVQSIDQMRKNHFEFLKQIQTFKDSLLQQSQTNLKYLLCRLDFNEYYHTMEVKNQQALQEMRNRGGVGEDLDDMDDDQDDDEDDDDEDDDDQDDDDDDDEENDDCIIIGSNTNQQVQYSQQQQQQMFQQQFQQQQFQRQQYQNASGSKGGVGLDSTLGLNSLGGAYAYNSNFNSQGKPGSYQ